MHASADYQLLDFGGGRKLERFGPHVLDRPSPAADRDRRERPALWAQAAARYERDDRDTGAWTFARPIDQPWSVHFGPLALELKLTDAGHLGVFPEQAANWQWIDSAVRRAHAASGQLKVLNLFAYTGASTLAAAAAGAEVVHVDAASGVVAWARRNAQASNLNQLPIRWIVEDVLEFVRRERRRGNRYDAVILDPPAYGHGPQGQTWKLQDHLDDLLAMCLELCGGNGQFVLMTCHSGPLARSRELLDYASTRLPGARSVGEFESGDMGLATPTGRRLHSGAFVRWRRST